MNVRRITTSLLIALAVSGVCTYALGRRMSFAQTKKLPTIRYVAPSRPLSSGELLKAEDLQVVSWPAADPVSGAFDRSDALIGRIVLYPVAPGQPLTDKLVSAAGAGAGLAARIPDGMRAIALKSDDVVGVAGFLAPGSHLDVLVTYRTEKQPEPTTLTVLQDAEVLAAGHQVQPDPEGKPATVTVVTLLLTPTDAERVVLASTQGTIHFVLRSGSDKVRTQQNAISLTQLSPGSDPAPSSESRDHPGRGPSTTGRGSTATGQITVEAVLGDKVFTSRFSKAGER